MADPSPLYVLLTVMRQRWAANDQEAAVALARVAAPYMHGRAVTMRPAGELAGISDDELDSWAGDFGGEAAAGEGPG